MSEAEEKFRAVVRQALIDCAALTPDREDLEDYVDAVVGSLKLDNWWIHPTLGILEVEYYEWVEWEDGLDQWDVWTFNEGEDDE